LASSKESDSTRQLSIGLILTSSIGSHAPGGDAEDLLGRVVEIRMPAAKHGADHAPEARSQGSQELPGGGTVALGGGARERHRGGGTSRRRFGPLFGHYKGHVSRM